ncbi:plasminogen receptor (KT)-like [Eriocheir sinensis]|uniref:plasminogen receptor (KT)-like n=1 Tax=Eriocheir sinensis TaxID=95602 RepID=UPI0021C71417|nr:plasminogen receptor (KT)-like [Eriocheir sinensis]
MFRELVSTAAAALGRKDVGSGQVILSLKDELARRQEEGAHRMVERQVALQVAFCRERLTWLLPMVGLSAAFLVAGYRVTRSSVVLYPLVPMSFAVFYQCDLAYGSKTNRIKGIAERILAEEASMVHVPEWHYTGMTPG